MLNQAMSLLVISFFFPSVFILLSSVIDYFIARFKIEIGETSLPI